MLRQRIHDDMIVAMKAKEPVKLETIRFIWSEIKNTEIDAKHELDDPEVTQLLFKEVKKRQEAIELMTKGGRAELAAADQVKLDQIKTYLPELMSRGEIETLVAEAISTGAKDMGTVMRYLSPKTKGKADGKLVSDIVREKLSLTP